MIKINSNKYIQFSETPDLQMLLSGWEWELRYYFFCMISVIIYTK
jgi:hypothetical protein